jgi:hypothetical protein
MLINSNWGNTAKPKYLVFLIFVKKTIQLQMSSLKLFNVRENCCFRR